MMTTIFLLAYDFCPFIWCILDLLVAAGQLLFVNLTLITAIGEHITERTGDKRAQRYVKQRISGAIQCGNAAAVLSTRPYTKGA